MPDPVTPKVPPPPPVPPAAGTNHTQPNPPTTVPSGETVVVACKLPNGLHLRLDKMQDGQTIQMADRVTLNGPNMPNALVAGGYAMTRVPKEFWDEWVKQNPDFQPFVAKPPLVYAQPSEQGAQSQAREQAAATSGLERLDPGRPGAKLEAVPGQPSGAQPAV